jgi:hypothetical protein
MPLLRLERHTPFVVDEIGHRIGKFACRIVLGGGTKRLDVQTPARA